MPDADLGIGDAVEIGQSILTSRAKNVLAEMAAKLREEPTLSLTIEGHTSRGSGTAEANLTLGTRRANAVRDSFVQSGIGSDRLSIVSYGEERPKYDNNRPETRRLNDRVTVLPKLRD